MKTFILSLFALFVVHTTYSQVQKPVKLRGFLQVAPSRDNAIPYGANPKAGHYANAGDARIYYEVYGQGKVFVILHGGVLGSTYDMAQFIENLSKTYQVVAISTRGHGKSEIGTAPVTYEQKANDVMAVIKAVTNEKATVLGFSDGAYTAYKLAAMYPEKVDKLIAIGAGDLYMGPRSYKFSQQNALTLDSLFWKQQQALNPEPQKMDGYLADLTNFYNHLTVSKELFNTIKCPVLVMAGERDTNAPLPTVINAYNMIPNSQLAIIPHAGHGVFLENFPAVWASIVPFLKN
jgi:pimeloyl-ACP methyl ester carboxylesterase